MYVLGIPRLVYSCWNSYLNVVQFWDHYILNFEMNPITAFSITYQFKIRQQGLELRKFAHLLETDWISFSFYSAVSTGQPWALGSLPKGGFFSESDICFSNLQNKLLQITILNLKFEIPAHNSKQLIQKIFWRFEKRLPLSEKKTPLAQQSYRTCHLARLSEV